ncbi:MAG: hypothetical protein Q8N59_02720 [bacterium]|nr:hypothetical protein [bacterium]
MTGPSIENLKAAAEELNKTGVNPVKGQRGAVEAQTPLEVPKSNWNHKENRPLTGQREQTSNGAEELRKENADFIEHPRQSRDLKENDPSINSGSSRVESRDEKTPNFAPQKGEMKTAGTALPDLIQEKMKLEKILQEMNNLKSKICQRIEIIKTIERRRKELNQQLASAGKENDFPDKIKKSFENLKENIKF